MKDLRVNSHQSSAAVACKMVYRCLQVENKYVAWTGAESQNPHLIVDDWVRKQARFLLGNILAGVYRALSLGHSMQLCSVVVGLSVVCVHLLHFLPYPGLGKVALDHSPFYWLHKSIAWQYVKPLKLSCWWELRKGTVLKGRSKISGKKDSGLVKDDVFTKHGKALESYASGWSLFSSRVTGL